MLRGRCSTRPDLRCPKPVSSWNLRAAYCAMGIGARISPTAMCRFFSVGGSPAEKGRAIMQHPDNPISTLRSLRRWRTVRQIAERLDGAFTEAAIRALIYRAEPHHNARGETVPGNGLASCIARPGGKGSRVLIDEVAFDAWLES